MRTRDRKGAARRKIVAERMRAFHDALLEEASTGLPNLRQESRAADSAAVYVAVCCPLALT